MKMASAGDIEETINHFTHSKTGEKVYLDLSKENTVILRSLCSNGSTPLGAFWVKLLQHPNNYPVYSYPYKKLYQAGQKFQLHLCTDGLSITIDLVTGQMIIKGQHVVDWFVHRFPEIMKGYSSPVQGTAQNLCKYYDKDQALALKYENEKMYRKYIEKWPLSVLEMAANVMHAGKNDREHYESILMDGFLNGDDLETHAPTAELLNDSDTKDQLERLTKGRVIQGCVLYRLWRSTLKMWLSDKDGKVFIVTPHIDCDRLSDLCELFLQNKLTASIETICIPIRSLYDSFAEVRRNTITRFHPQDQVIIEYKIYSNIVYPLNNFTTSFIAMVKDGVAYILQTNINFDRSNFISSRCATVDYLLLDEAAFRQNYLDPIFV